MDVKRERLTIVAAGLVIGVIAAGLTALGNPVNMGFCIACFLRDISGALGLHQAAAVQYIRPCGRGSSPPGGGAPLSPGSSWAFS